MKDRQLYHINFGGYKGSEINNIHLGIIFTMPNINNMVFCIPLTSPKQKHFKSVEAFNSRNHLYLKHQTLVYIDQTDSIALLDQMRTISTQRLLKQYKDCNNENIVLNDKNTKLLTIKALKYLRNILEKKRLELLE